MGGLDFLGRITALPCLPYDFGNSLSSDSLVQVVRTLAEANAQETLAFLSRLVRASLDATASFWEAGTGLAGLLEFGARDAPAANARYRALITLQTRVTLISEVYASAGHSSGRTAHAVLQALLGPDVPQIVPALGALHRACIRENVVLKRTAPAVAGAQVERTTLGEDVEMEIAPAASVNLAVPAPDAAATSLAVPALDQPDQPASVKRNSQALKQLVTQIPAALAPLFQGMHALTI
jgi:E3 ubiquitin-protein ligase HUWE1